MSNLSKRVLAVMLASSFTLGIQGKPVQSNPVALAPALCATGAGCFLVGTVVIGGALYYVWKYGGGKQVAADAAGNIMRILEDPEVSDGEWEDPLNTANYEVARKTCNQIARRHGAELIEIRRHPATGKLTCVFRGGNS